MWQRIEIELDGSTPLHKAAADKTHHHLLKELLKIDHRVNYRDKNGNYPLLLALSNGCSFEVFLTLLKFRASVEVRNKRGANALHCAIEGSDENNGWNFLIIDELFVFHELFAERDNGYETPFAYLLKQGYNVDVFNVFWQRHSMWSDSDTLNHNVVPALGRFPELCNLENQDGLIPLDYALQNNCSVDVFEVLWNQHLASSDNTCRPNFLISAVIGNCDVQILRKILDKYKSMMNSPDKHGRLPIHYASHSKELLKILIEAGSNLWHKDKDNCIPLSFCVKERHPNVAVVREFLKHMDVNKLFEEEKSLDFSYLVMAFFQGECSINVFNLFLDAGFSIMTNHFGRPAINIICEHLDTDSIVEILKKLPDIFLIRKDLRNKYIRIFDSGLVISNVVGIDWVGVSREFSLTVIKFLALQDTSLTRRTLQPEGNYKLHKCLFDYFEACKVELNLLKNLKVSSSKSLHDLVLEKHLNTSLSTDKKCRDYWKLFNKVLDFEISCLTIYKDEVSEVKQIVFACQLYKERLCTKKNDGSVLFLTHLATKHIFDYLSIFHLDDLAKVYYNVSPSLQAQWANAFSKTNSSLT